MDNFFFLLFPIFFKTICTTYTNLFCCCNFWDIFSLGATSCTPPNVDWSPVCIIYFTKQVPPTPKLQKGADMGVLFSGPVVSLRNQLICLFLIANSPIHQTGSGNPILKVMQMEKLCRGKLKCTVGPHFKSSMTVQFL